MIDSGETDWKIIAIDVNDPEAERYNAPADVPRRKLNEVFTFLRDYKIPDGNPPNNFAFNSEIKEKDFSLNICDETHQEWRNLINNKFSRPDIKLAATEYQCPSRISTEEAEGAIGEQHHIFVQSQQ